MLYTLLRNGAERARKIVAEFTPQFPSKEAYFAYVDRINAQGDRIVYREDGVAEVQL